jgi:hypothetical protein
MGERYNPILGLTLTEAQAWLEIARRVDRLKSTDGYLCDQVGYLAGEHCADYPPFDYGNSVGILRDVADRMKRRVRSYMDEDWHSAYPDGELYEDNSMCLDEFRKGRVIAALWFACEAKSESTSPAKALVPNASESSVEPSEERR